MAQRPPSPIVRPSGAVADQTPAAAPSRRRPLLVAAALYVLVSLLVFGAIGVGVLQLRLAERDERLARLAGELATRTAEQALLRGALEGQVAELRRSLTERHARVNALADENARLVTLGERQATELAALAGERDLARQRAGLLDAGARETEVWLETAQRERMALERERAALQARLGSATAERDLAQRAEQGLRWRIARLEQRVAEITEQQDVATGWLHDWVGGRVGAIERVLAETGLDAQRLLARAGGMVAGGQGGPLVPIGEARPGTGAAPAILGLASASAAPLVDEVARLRRAQLLLTAVPLAPPLDQHHVTSHFGARADPLTRLRARHNGLDLGAPQGSKVLATAPGRVTAAGRQGAYGIMVEIDHGLGLTTRYAHLQEALVEAGQRVTLRQPVGVIGSTGRSTGRHLHYEVRFDGEALDPAGFIDAGRRLVAMLRD